MLADRQSFSLSAVLIATMKDIVFLDYTQEELDLYYDQRRWHPKADAEIERYLRCSAELRSRLPYRRYSYGPTSEETLDWYPGSNKLAPTIVFVHGGAWINFTSDFFSFIAGGFAAQGFNTCIINFAGLTTVRMPQMLEQVRRSICWVAEQASELNVDVSRIHLCGHSSGAHLACLALLTQWSSYGFHTDDFIHSASLISGTYDLKPVMLSARRSYIQLDPAEIEALSPIRHADKIRCPVLLTYCEHDTPEFKRHARALEETLHNLRKPVRKIRLSEANHFDCVFPLAQAESILSREISSMVVAT